MSEDSPVNETERQGTEKESTDSPVPHIPTTDKEHIPFAPAHADVEDGDTGILVHAAPLARKLKGRHMQMIAIGKYFHNEEVHRLNSHLCRWSNWSWFVCWIGKCVGDWWAGKFGTYYFPRFFAETNVVVKVLGYIIIGSMLLVTVQALGELAVLFPVNGAFFTYVVRFVDPSLYVLPLVLVLVELM